MTTISVLPLYYYLCFFLGSFALSLVLTPVIRRLSLATGRVAVPRGDRWHKRATPLMGGVSIFISTIAVWAVAVYITGWGSQGQPFVPMILCATGIFLLGLIDDIFSVDPQHKLAGQIIITAILIFFGFRLGWTNSYTVNLVFSIVWIVGITNAFNLLDNMDGLSAGIALIAGTFFFLTQYLNPHGGLLVGPSLLMAAAYLGAVLGFLIYNFNPASIFMGDAGSLFIGFVLACLTVTGSAEKSVGASVGHLLSVIAIPILIVFIPILDTGFVSVMRKLFRRPISQGGRDHSSHRMVAIGFSERKAVLILYAFAVVSGLIALVISHSSTGINLVIITLYLLFILFFWVYLAKVKVYSEDSILSQDSRLGVTPILIEITYRRRLFEVSLDVLLITVSYYTAYLLRFEGVLGGNFDFFLKSLPIVIACQVLSFFVIGVYRGVWESTSLSDLIDYVKAITIGAVLPMLILLFLYRFYSFSRAVFIIYWILMLVLVSLSRLSFRLLKEGVKKDKQRGKPTLVYGAGIGGQMVAKEIENNQDLGLVLVGFIDDNPGKHKRRIMGYPVLGGRDDLEEIIKRNNIQEIIVSFRLNGNERKRELKSFCRHLDAEIEVTQMRLVIS